MLRTLSIPHSAFCLLLICGCASSPTRPAAPAPPTAPTVIPVYNAAGIQTAEVIDNGITIVPPK